ncbi:hypothetical protein DFH09DRAFT_1308580 [Mycena vulgaris]|nr:hypothetical protein DFH09DRAFT_1308580 [Mycena vulgaris]
MAELIIDSHHPFVPADWIGTGKQYSGDLPFEVINAKNVAFELPAEWAGKLMPARNLPVMKFSELKLPRHSSELAYGESQLWFSNDEPTMDISLLGHRSIPPSHVLDLLGRKSGQAWLNGAKSISDPRNNEGADRFPLWILTLWQNMLLLIEQQAGWRRSIQWLANERSKCKTDDTRAVIDEARTLLDTMGWNTPLPYERKTTSTLNLLEFLGSVWLKTTQVDIMMEDLAGRVASDPDLDTVIIAKLAFSQGVLTAAKGDYTKRETALLHRYEREVKEEGKTKLVFPANLANCHWVSGVIDFTQKTIRFGDSLPGFFNPPKKLIVQGHSDGHCYATNEAIRTYSSDPLPVLVDVSSEGCPDWT